MDSKENITWIQKYLKYVKQNYSEFRYISDKNILEKLDFFESIDYKIVSNEIWFCIIYTDFRVSKDTCFFWFLEIYEKLRWKEFLRQIENILNIFNCKILVWPINFSIWNNYRFWSFKVNNEKVLWEYDTDTSINDLLLENNFKIYERYITAKRHWKNPYTLNGDFNDYKIEKININKDTLKIIYSLSVLIFIEAPKISFAEFWKYMQVYMDLYKNNINEFILTYKWKNIWFLSSFYTNQYFVIKTIWVLKEFRWKWLWNFLLSYVYDYYLDLGYNNSYYLYMREKWDALNMTDEGAEKYREYFTYYIEL